MKKISLLILLLAFSSIPASAYFTYDFEFKLVQDDKTKICQAFDDGYVCKAEEPVYYENFKKLFLPIKTNYHIVNDEKCLTVLGGYKCSGKPPVLFGKGAKGVLIKDELGKEQICKMKRNGNYECPKNEELYSMIIPYGNWKFTRSLGFFKEKFTNNCIGYKNGYICPGEEPKFVKNFRKTLSPLVDYSDIHFYDGGKTECYDLQVSKNIMVKDASYCYGNIPNITMWHDYSIGSKGIFVAEKDNPSKTKICKLFSFDKYIQYGYVCNAELPVILKHRPPVTKLKNTSNYYVYRKDIITGENKKITCQKDQTYYYCPGEPKQNLPQVHTSVKTQTEKRASEIRHGLEGTRLKLPDGSTGRLRFWGNTLYIDKY